jgi:hypothetical protein
MEHLDRYPGGEETWRVVIYYVKLVMERKLADAKDLRLILRGMGMARAVLEDLPLSARRLAVVSHTAGKSYQ